MSEKIDPFKPPTFRGVSSDSSGWDWVLLCAGCSTVVVRVINVRREEGTTRWGWRDPWSHASTLCENCGHQLLTESKDNAETWGGIHVVRARCLTPTIPFWPFRRPGTWEIQKDDLRKVFPHLAGIEKEKT
jgi:hypothetical protein